MQLMHLTYLPSHNPTPFLLLLLLRRRRRLTPSASAPAFYSYSQDLYLVFLL